VIRKIKDPARTHTAQPVSQSYEIMIVIIFEKLSCQAMYK